MADEIIKEDILPVETIVTPDPDPKPKPKPNPYTKKVYDNLLDAYGQDHLPTYEIFSQKIADPKYRYAVRENLLDVYGAGNVPDFKAFNDSLDVVIPEKKNLGATGGDGYVPLESALKSIPRTEAFDKNANPIDLILQANDYKQKEVNDNVAVDLSGMPVQSSTDYNPEKIKIADDIEKHLDDQGFTKDFRETLLRIKNLPNPAYREAGGVYSNNDEVLNEYKQDPDAYTKRMHRILWQENLAQNFNDLANYWIKIDSKENEANNLKEYSQIGHKFNYIASQIFDNNTTLDNRQYNIQQASDAIKQYIRDPEAQKQALKDLAISTSGAFGTLEDYTDKRLHPIGNLNEWQSMGLNYLDRVDNKTSEFYRKYLDVNPEDFKSSYEQAGYEEQRKNLEEIGLQLFINNGQQELNELSKKANQQGNVLDEEDLNKFNDLSQRVKEATDRLNNLPDLYPYAKDVETYQIAQELTDNGNSMFGNAARKLKGGLLNIGGTVANLGADIFGSKETQNRMALKTLGLSTESEIETMPTRAQSALVRPMPKIDKDLQQQINKVNNDNTLTKDQRTEKVDLLLQQNKDKWTPSSAETSWNLSATAVASTVLNTAADLAPFIATMALTEGMAAGAPAILPEALGSFAKMYGNVLLTSYNQELANEMKNNNPEAERDAFANVLVNTLAFEVAGKGGTFIKGIRENAAKAGGRVSDLISKLSDEQILKAAKNQNTTLKGFLNNAKEVLPKKAAEGVKSAAKFELVMGGSEFLQEGEITPEKLKEAALRALSFSLLNTIGGFGLEMSNLNTKNKRDLYNAAVHKDQVLYELDKAKANGKMTNEAYNQAKQNVEAAAKVLEKTPMVDENGKKLKEKQAIELMTRKIQSQLMQDNMKKELPEKLKKKMADEWLKNEEKINDIYKGNFSEETGKPFAGLEERVAKRKIEEEKAPEVKPTDVETKITDIQKNLDLANKIEKARSGDKKAQEELTKFGIKYDKNPIYRHVSESEVNALNNGEQIEGKFKNGRVDVTTNSKPSTGANAEYRITFNDTYDFNKGDKAKVKNEELGDGWIAEGGYNKGDVLRIEKRNEDGSYTSVYEGKNKTVEGELNKQLSDLQGDKTQQVKPTEVGKIENKDDVASQLVIDGVTPEYGSTRPPIDTLIENILDDNGNVIGKREYVGDEEIAKAKAEGITGSSGARYSFIKNKTKLVKIGSKQYRANIVLYPDGKASYELYEIDAVGNPVRTLTESEKTTETKKELKREEKTVELIPEVTVEGLTEGYKVLAGKKRNAVGDIRQDASEARIEGKDTFTKETIKDGKKTFTLVDTTPRDNFGRPGYKSVSITLPKGTKLTIKDVMPSLEAAMKGEKVPNIKFTQIEEVKTVEETKPTQEVKSEKLVTFEDLKNYEKLPGYQKYGSKNKNVNLRDLDITPENTKNAKEFAEKLAAVDGPLKPIATAISRMPGLNRIKYYQFKEAGKAEPGLDYSTYSGQYDRASLPFLNLASIEMREIPGHNEYLTGIHELIHWVTMSSDNVDVASPEYNTLKKIYKYIAQNEKFKDLKSGEFIGKNYGLYNYKEFFTELLSNPDFRKNIEDIFAKNKEEFLKVVGENKEFIPDLWTKGFIQGIISLIKRIINKVTDKYKDPLINYDKSMLDNALDLAVKSFFERNDINKKLEVDKDYENKKEQAGKEYEVRQKQLKIIDKQANTVKDILGVSEDVAQAISILHNSNLPLKEKNNLIDLHQKYPRTFNLDVLAEKAGEINKEILNSSSLEKWAKDLLSEKNGNKAEITPKDIIFKELTPEDLKPVEITPIPEIKDFTLGYAPFKEGKITDISQGEKAFDNKAFKAWKKMANTFAENIGLEIVSDNNTIGKYGATSTIGEASSVPTVRGTKEQVELFAALMGTLAPEGQHSVMTLEYNPNGKTEEHRITFKDRKAAQEFLENSAKYGIEDISLFPESNTVMILDNGNVDHKTLNNDYENRITGHKRLKVNQDFITQDRYSGLLQKYGDSLGGRYPSAYGENITDAIQLAKERAGRFGSDYDQKSEQAQIEAKEATKNYIDKNKKSLGLPDTEETTVKKVDTELAKKIKDAYDALPVDDSKNPEVAAAYNKAAEEIDKQFQYLTKDLGIKVEFIKDDPYKNSDEMFEDIINNKKLKVFQGGEDHPFLGEVTKDANGFTGTEKFRAVHDYFGHFVNRNQFGKIGEETAWVDHSKMFSPDAQRAVSTETRGQNSWVNFSGVNDVAIEKMKQGNDLIKEGKITEGNKLIAEGQAEFKYAEQKVALMPEELTDWYQYTERGKAPKTKVKIQEPEIEEVQPVKTPQQVEISKRALGENYNFSKEFDVRGGDVVATDVLTEVTKRAEENNVDVPTQRAIEVNRMADGNAEPTEYNIITAGSHLLSIDKKIDIAQNTGNLVEVENLTQQREQVLSVLRNLGNKAGRNLGLFNLVFQETDRSEIKLTRDHLKNILKVEEVPETIAELDKSNLTAEQKKTVRPYVEKIEKAKAQFNSIEKEVNSSIVKINDQEINAALDKARSEGKKQGFEEGLKSASNDVKQKKSKQLKDLASKIRISDEYDKFLKGIQLPSSGTKQFSVDYNGYKKIVADVIDDIAKSIESKQNLNEALINAVNKFNNIDKEKLVRDVKTIISKSQLPNKADAIEAISNLAKSEGIRNISKAMADNGLVKDIVNSYLGEDLTNDQVLDAATKDLKSILPDVTREDVADAYAERNQFKKQTKAKLEDEINKKKADVRRLAVKEARLRALEAANDYHAEESTQNKKAARSEYEAELDEKIKALLKEKSDAQKVQKTSKSPKTEQDKIDEINREIEYVKTTKSVYEQAIKNPKKASDALIAAREERAKTYADLGLKLEKSAKSPILIERDYQEALSQIERSDLSNQEKNDRKEELKAQRDLDLLGTKQFVVSSLSSDLDAIIESSMEKAVDATIAKDQETANSNLRVKDKLQDIKDLLNPTGEKIDDQINKAYNKLNELLVDEKITKESKSEINQLIKNLKNNNQLTSDQLSAQRLKKQFENEIRTAETDIASGNFTKIPSTTYDYRRNDELVRLNKARENKSGQFNRLVADAKEKARTTPEKALDLSTKFLVSGIHTTLKVAEAGSFKPFIDSMVDLTFGRVASYITGAPYTSLYSVKKGFKTFAAFKNKEAAEKYINKLKDNRDYALENLQNAYENGSESDIKKADKEFKKADLEYAVSTLYNSIESNSLNSFWQYIKHGATDYDVSIGKSTKKDISDYRTILGKTGYVLDGWIRMHGAMKSTLSARPEMMKVFSSTLKDFQRKGMELSPENISTAMVLAADAYEAGRLTNKTALSKIISRGKGSEKSTALRLITKGLMPVSTIAVNLAKRGIDYSTLGTEGFVRLANETKKGMKLNEVEGKTYDGLISAIKDGWKQIPLKERVYINGVIGRGLFGSAIMLATAYGLANGNVKYGGTYDDQRKRKIMGSDGQQLKAGEWEFFGVRLPKAASLFLNHLPEFLSVSLIADNYQINQMGGSAGDKFETTIDEVEARLPFQTLAGMFVPGKRVNTLVDRFTRIPIAAEIGGFFDKKGEFRDKKDFMNRIRGNVGLGVFNPTKKQQEQIDILYDRIKNVPPSAQTPEFKAKMNKAIETIKNIDFKELEVKEATEKAMEEARKAMEAEKNKKN